MKCKLPIGLCWLFTYSMLHTAAAQEWSFRVAPGIHESWESERLRDAAGALTDTVRPECRVDARGGGLAALASFLTFGIWDPLNDVSPDVSPAFPQWVPVEPVQNRVVALEGTAVTNPEEPVYPTPHIAFEDFPPSHYTHDFTFFVEPLAGTFYENLRGVLPASREGPAKPQESIEVEWESGLGASNDGNSCSVLNEIGQSCGFFSAGHLRRETIWNWPTIGDRVYVVGNWVWDRGHWPSRTEIHPARFVAIQRHLPDFQPTDPDHPHASFGTRIDIFGNGDGGRLWNNIGGEPPFVESGPMNDRDYGFTASNTLPRPTPQAELRWLVTKKSADTFGPDLQITLSPDDPASVNILVPWHSRSIENTAILARSLFLYWEGETGISDNYGLRAFRVKLDKLFVHHSMDVGDGEYRLFAEVGGNWLFINEMPGDDNILDEGLGDTGDDEPWGIGREFLVYVGENDSFRVHGGGWEADAVNDVFGKTLDPQSPCDADLDRWLGHNLVNEEVWRNGGPDDPIGEVNAMHGPGDNYGVGNGGNHEESSKGTFKKDPSGNSNPDDAFRLIYHIEEVSLR